MDSQGQMQMQKYQKRVNNWGPGEDVLREEMARGGANADVAAYELNKLQEAQTALNQVREQELDREVDRLQGEWSSYEDHTLNAVYYRHLNGYDRRLREEAQRQNGSVNANRTAEGMPIVEQAAAKQPYKQIKEEGKRTRKAQRFNKNADHVSYNMLEQMQNRKNEADEYIDGKKFGKNVDKNSPEYIANESRMLKIKNSGLDKEMLKTYYQRGKPKFVDKYINAADWEQKAEQAKGKNETWQKTCEDNARKERTEALDILVNDLLKTQITPDMFQPAYLEAHMGEMKALADRMSSFKQKIRDDAKNSFYFNSEDRIVSTQVQLLDEKLALLTGDVCAQLDYAAGQKSVDVLYGNYMTEKQSPRVTEDHSRHLADKLSQWNSKEQEIGGELVWEEARTQLKEILRGRTETAGPATETKRFREILADLDRISQEIGQEHEDYVYVRRQYDEVNKYAHIAEDFAAQAEAYGAVCSAHPRTAVAEYARAKQKEYERRIEVIESQVPKDTISLKENWESAWAMGGQSELSDGEDWSGAGA